MICRKPPRGCGGCGTVFKNEILIDCPKCSGKGEHNGPEPTYNYPEGDLRNPRTPMQVQNSIQAEPGS